jgi:hypothetical protein
VASDKQVDEDRDLELIKAKKIRELKKLMISPKPKDHTPRMSLVSRLVDRGLEVLEKAEASYPKEVEVVVKKLADLIDRGVVRGNISGGELYELFNALGMRVHIETTISVEKHGRLVPLADRLRSD